jgi:inositol transport system substrate-binding protein
MYIKKHLATMIKRTLSSLLVTAVLFGCGGSETANGPVIGVTMLSLQNEFVVNVADEIEKKAKEQGVKLILVDAERSALKQVEQVESFIAQKVDAIILNPCEVEASSPAVEKAKAAGIPIVNVNSETNAAPSAFVGSDDVESGRIAMRYIAEKLGGKGNILIMHGYMGQAAQIQRDRGAKEILTENSGLVLLAEQTGNWDRAKAMSLTENWIQSYGSQIQAIFAQNDEMGLGAVKALSDAGLKDKVVVVSIDAIPDALRAVKNGSLDATVFQNAVEQGSQSLEIALKLINGESVDKKTLIPFELVTGDNVSEYMK